MPIKRITMLALVAASLIAAGMVAPKPVKAAGAPAALTNCTICHDVSSAKKKMVGPPLAGVFGRKPSIAGVPFKAWDQAALDKWLADAQKVKPGTAMSYKVPDAKARGAVIAALKTLK